MDLFVCNGALNPTIRPNPNFFFEYENGKYKQVAKEVGLQDYKIGRGSVVFDYDNDGDLDLLVVNQVPRDPSGELLNARCLLYRNDAPKGNWLKISLQGVEADRNGLGSRVEVEVDGKLLLREIEGGSSHASQNSTIAHFGLGNAKEVNTLTVKWIGGKQQVLQKVAANQHLIIKENMDDSDSKVVKKNELIASPTTFSDQLFLTYELEEETPMEINILDSQGRMIERLVQFEQPISMGIWEWQVPQNLTSGVYIFQLKTPKAVIATRAIKF